MMNLGVAATPSTCAPVDYRGQVGPARNQTDTDLCFAYTAADMISQAVGERVSALDLASSFYLENIDRLHDSPFIPVRNLFRSQQASLKASLRHARDLTIIAGNLSRIDHLSNGDTDATILMANVKGLCAETRFPSDAGYSLEDSRWIESRASVALRDPHSCQNWPFSPGVVSTINNPLADCVNAQWLARIESRCARKPWPKPLLVGGLALTDQLSEYQTMLKDPHFDRKSARRRLLDILDSTLDAGKIAGISFNGNLLWGGRMNDDSGDHASSVVARREVEGRCMYLVRDSFGEDCEDYRRRFDHRCEAGHIWLTRRELSVEGQLYGVSYIE